MQIRYSTCSVFLNVMATQYTCSLNDIYCPHWLVQWSRHCSRMCIPVHSPWPPGHISIVQTTLIVLTIAAVFLDRPGVYVCVHCGNALHILALLIFIAALRQSHNSHFAVEEIEIEKLTHSRKTWTKLTIRGNWNSHSGLFSSKYIPRSGFHSPYKWLVFVVKG